MLDGLALRASTVRKVKMKSKSYALLFSLSLLLCSSLSISAQQNPVYYYLINEKSGVLDYVPGSSDFFPELLPQTVTVDENGYYTFLAFYIDHYGNAYIKFLKVNEEKKIMSESEMIFNSKTYYSTGYNGVAVANTYSFYLENEFLFVTKKSIVMDLLKRVDNDRSRMMGIGMQYDWIFKKYGN